MVARARRIVLARGDALRLDTPAGQHALPDRCLVAGRLDRRRAGARAEPRLGLRLRLGYIDLYLRRNI